MNNSELYKKSLKIREFEKILLKTHSSGEVSGTIHTCIGQELNALCVIDQLKTEDIVFSNHRGHGHFLAKTNKFEELLNEILGNEVGINSGVGGSQHVHDLNYYTNGIQGGSVPVAAGYAFSNQLNKKDSICVSFIGDGTLGEGVVYETLNLLGVLKAPVLIIVENNQYAQSSKFKDTFAGNPLERLSSFGLDCFEVSPLELEVMIDRIKKSIDEIRTNKKAQIIIINTTRIGPHSKGDDSRSKEEIEEAINLDPLILLKKNIKDSVDIELEVSKYINELESKVRK